MKYANDVLASYLIRLYMYRYYELYADYMMDNVPSNVLCRIALDYQSFLEQSGQSTDKHLRLIVNFILVLSDFLEFMLVYQSQDSITIEHGNKWFASIWNILGQVKYFEVMWEQMDCLYGHFPYSGIQEIRMNRQVRTYPGSTEESALAQDEWLLS